MSTVADRAKQNARASMVTRRRARSAQERQRAAEAIALHATALAPLARARRVAAYLSLPSEPGTGPLLAWLAERGVEIIVPISRADRTMDWAAHACEAVTVGALGVPEPVGPALPGDPLAACDVAVIPALAVDHAGNRLGRGAGYYDRALESFTGVVCALVFDDELVPELPHSSHDRPVDLVLTPAGPFRPERG